MTGINSNVEKMICRTKTKCPLFMEFSKDVLRGSKRKNHDLS